MTSCNDSSVNCFFSIQCYDNQEPQMCCRFKINYTQACIKITCPLATMASYWSEYDRFCKNPLSHLSCSSNSLYQLTSKSTHREQSPSNRPHTAHLPPMIAPTVTVATKLQYQYRHTLK